MIMRDSTNQVKGEEDTVKVRADTPGAFQTTSTCALIGKRVAVVLFSTYPSDPRPRRAAEALVEEGMVVDLICLTENEKDLRRETFNGVNILRLPLTRRRGGKFDYFFRYSTFIFCAFVILSVRFLNRRYDLVHVHNMPDILVLSGLIPRAFGAKIILDLHDPMPELMMTIFGEDHDSPMVRLLKRLEKWSIGLADLVLTPNFAFKRLFASRSCPSEKISIVMNSPDNKIFGRRSPRSPTSITHTSNKRFVVMYHGSLVERNGVDLAVDAIARIRRSVPSVELQIYGHPTPFIERVMASVQEKGLHHAIRYLGPKRLEDLVGVIEECDVGIIPNHRSVFAELNMPTRIFEYLAIGKPVIAPFTPGIQDYFNSESLFFFQLGSPEDLARQIEYVFSHPTEAIEIVKRGQVVYQSHAWNQEKLVLVNLVSELLSGGKQAQLNKS